MLGVSVTLFATFLLYIVDLICWKKYLQDDNYIHRPSGECQPFCILTIAGALEGQHLQTGV